ncbi:unnamed protein product [Angiostrongylus costaricensis]|uniref:Major sperm protein n=1 Tax=Angiostrongylus costaricensis TaxID=334426 RepID=A0A0R3PYZ5_ANGCS|nr:unnamed protein product [Angiostrongylus costaricensis]
MWWLLAVPAGAVAIFGCGDTNRVSAGKSSKSARQSGKSGRSGKSTRSGRSGKQRRSSSKSGRSQSRRKETSSKSNISGKSRQSRRSKRSKKSKSSKVVSSSTPAKPSELRVEPAELSYKAIGGLKGVNIVNDTNERKFFKVRCSDNMLYRVNPVFGVVEPGRSSRIDILRQNGAAKIDKIVLVTTRAAEGELPSREAFIRAKDTEMMVLPLLVQE